MKILDIDPKEIDNVANLSRIKLDDAEKVKFKNQLVHILEYVEKLNELNINNVKPIFYTSPLKNVFREDTLKVSFHRSNILNISPSHVNGFFKVPKIIE